MRLRSASLSRRQNSMRPSVFSTCWKIHFSRTNRVRSERLACSKPRTCSLNRSIDQRWIYLPTFLLRQSVLFHYIRSPSLVISRLLKSLRSLLIRMSLLERLVLRRKTRHKLKIRPRTHQLLQNQYWASSSHRRSRMILILRPFVLSVRRVKLLAKSLQRMHH